MFVTNYIFLYTDMLSHNNLTIILFLTKIHFQEGETLDAYGEWVPIETADTDIATSRKFQATIPVMITSLSDETMTTAGVTENVEKPIFVPDNGSIFPDQLLQVRNTHIVHCMYILFRLLVCFIWVILKTIIKFMALGKRRDS